MRHRQHRLRGSPGFTLIALTMALAAMMTMAAFATTDTDIATSTTNIEPPVAVQTIVATQLAPIAAKTVAPASESELISANSYATIDARTEHIAAALRSTHIRAVHSTPTFQSAVQYTAYEMIACHAPTGIESTATSEANSATPLRL